MTDLTLVLQYADMLHPNTQKDVTNFRGNGYIELLFGKEQEQSCQEWSVYGFIYRQIY